MIPTVKVLSASAAFSYRPVTHSHVPYQHRPLRRRRLWLVVRVNKKKAESTPARFCLLLFLCCLDHTSHLQNDVCDDRGGQECSCESKDRYDHDRKSLFLEGIHILADGNSRICKDRSAERKKSDLSNLFDRIICDRADTRDRDQARAK